MKMEFSPIQETPTNSDYPADPGATVAISYTYNYKDNWIEAGQDAVEQIIAGLGFKSADEFNAFYSIYGFDLLIKSPVGYIHRGIYTDRLYVKSTKHYTKQSVFSDFLISSAQSSQSFFRLSDPSDAYLYLFGRVTDNYSEAERFNHIRNWFLNKTGIYK